MFRTTEEGCRVETLQRRSLHTAVACTAASPEPADRREPQRYTALLGTFTPLERSQSGSFWYEAL